MILVRFPLPNLTTKKPPEGMGGLGVRCAIYLFIQIDLHIKILSIVPIALNFAARLSVEKFGDIRFRYLI